MTAGARMQRGLAGFQGAAFPNASTTGSPPVSALYQVTGSGNTTTAANTALSLTGSPLANTGWAWSSTFVNVASSNAILNGLYLPSAGVNIAAGANNVTIMNCHIVKGDQSGSDYPVKLSGGVTGGTPGITGTTIQDCTLSGTDGLLNRADALVKDVNNTCTGTAVLRCNMYWSEVGFAGAMGTVQDCYMHDIGHAPGDHNEWTNTEAPPGVAGNGLVIRHNTMLNYVNQTAVVYAAPLGSGDPVPNTVTIDGNLLAGAGYCIYAAATSGTGVRADSGCTVTASSSTVTDASALATDIGGTVTGTGIASGTTVTNVSGSTVTLSQNATASGTVTLTYHLAYGFVITNNAFSTMFYPSGGFDGSHNIYDTVPASNVWTGNYWYDGASAGTAIGP